MVTPLTMGTSVKIGTSVTRTNQSLIHFRLPTLIAQKGAVESTAGSGDRALPAPAEARGAKGAAALRPAITG